MSPLLSVYRIRKQFGQRQLFDIDALVIRAASAYALTGLNGSGKSTLLKILAGLEQADIGEAYFHGRRVAFHPYLHDMRNAIVYVHQHPIMFSTSVADNIGYGLVKRGVSSHDVDRLVAEAIDWAEIGHLRKNNPLTLSGGEKQRVALARAKVLNPELLLLDEPTANLDGAAREQVISLISNLTAAGGSVMMATHDRDLIRLPGVQRLKLQDGRLQARQNRIRVA